MASFIPSTGDGAVHLKRTSPDGASAERAAIKCSLRALKHPETEEDVDRVLRRVSSLARHRPQHEAVRNYVGHATLHQATSGTPLARAALPLVGAVLKFSREGFERALANDPTDSTARLVFADWLDENGHPEAAARARWFHAAIHHEPKPGAPTVALPAWVWALHDHHDIARLGVHTPASMHHNAQLELSALGLVPPQEAERNADNDPGLVRSADIPDQEVLYAHRFHSRRTTDGEYHDEPTTHVVFRWSNRLKTGEKLTQYAALNPPPGGLPPASATPLARAVLKFSREAFERALANEPHEWTPRLVFADWLDEHGHPEAAARARWFHAAIHHEPKPGTPNRVVPAWVWALHDYHDIARLGDHTPESRHHNAQLELSALGLVPHREAQENAQRDLGAAWESRNRNIDETIVGAVVRAAHAAHSSNTHNRLQHYEPTRIPLLYTPERQSTAYKITQYAALNPPPGAQAGRVAERPGA
jgi:uncharacterized protein (TIGR02996 family)